MLLYFLTYTNLFLLHFLFNKTVHIVKSWLLKGRQKLLHYCISLAVFPSFIEINLAYSTV